MVHLIIILSQRVGTNMRLSMNWLVLRYHSIPLPFHLSILYVLTYKTIDYSTVKSMSCFLSWRLVISPAVERSIAGCKILILIFFIYNLIATKEELGLQLWWVDLQLFCSKLRSLHELVLHNAYYQANTSSSYIYHPLHSLKILTGSNQINVRWHCSFVL